ncbi:hypothetical protein MJK72_22805 [Klebsiella pneumoniae]|nr:hypothetical protein MJK72_22805 [Klebsiella pneumoniae]
MLMMIDVDRIDLQPGEVIKKQMVRFRALGCWPLTGAIGIQCADAAGDHRRYAGVDHQ